MKNKTSLTEQLLYLSIIIISIVVVSLGIILPKTLLPIYEENLYNYLKQPLDYIEDIDDVSSKINSQVGFIYVKNNSNNITISENLSSIIELEKITDVIKSIDGDYGKFKIKNKTYYYYSITNNNDKRIALTDNKYILDMKKNIFSIILLIVGITFALVSIIVILWSNNLVSRIKKLKEKIDNIDNYDYSFDTSYAYDDELHILDLAVDNMRVYLKENETYKNQMYQNISHDFKTPITVMKSYIEASEDGVETKEKTLEIIKEQLNKLEIKVHSLLYLNKLNYIKDQKNVVKTSVDIKGIINNSAKQFKTARNDVKLTIDMDDNTIFRGSENMWEAIIDNILNNFIRYAKKEVKITVKNNKITLYNDGPNIEENILNDIFTPYEKGIKGVFGLGLSIVKKTLQFLKYDITVENAKNGVKFIIK